MNREMNFTEFRRQLKRDARADLSKRNARLELAFGALLLIALYIGIKVVMTAVLIITSEFYDIFAHDTYGLIAETIISVPQILLSAPLLLGYFGLAGKLTRGTVPDFSEIFDYYKSFRLIARSWLAALIVFVPIKLAVVATETGFYLLSLWENVNPLYYIAAAVSVVIIFAALMIPYGLFFPLLKTLTDDKDRSFGSCLGETVKRSAKHVFEIYIYRFSFFGWIALSLLTVGVLFLIFTLPYMMTAYQKYSGCLLTGMYQSNDSEDTDI